jgi:phosphoglycolate phosphatase-like HAD superfamily hydrolase
MVVRPTVLLFDIDGTLVTTGGAGRRAIERAFEAFHGRAGACLHFPFDGMTDRAIVRQGLTQLGLEPTEARIDEVLVRYVPILEEEVARVEASRYRVHAGMEEAVLAALSAGLAVGLGTGNVREGARVKLERVGLYQYFSFGGFGDEHELRPVLLRRGAERGAHRLGVTLGEARVVVIGDTPKDVAAAQAIGAQSIGVATGNWSVKQLLEAGATWAFETLATPGALDVVLRGAEQPPEAR